MTRFRFWSVIDPILLRQLALYNVSNNKERSMSHGLNSKKKKVLGFCIERNRNQKGNWQLYIATEMANGKLQIYVSMKENPSFSSLISMRLDLGEIGLNDTLSPIFHLCGIIKVIRKMVG